MTNTTDKTISRYNIAMKIVEAGYGKEFVVVFTKANGDPRVMRAVTPKASFNTDTNEFSYEPTEKGLLSCIDLDLVAAKKVPFRMVPLSRVHQVTIGDTAYTVI